MEKIYTLIAVCGIIIILVLGWRVLNWVYLRPKKVETYMRQQGFKGNSYKLFLGDMKEMSMMTKQAKSKPMEFSNDIVHRVIPFFHKSLNIYGKNFITWLGPKPMVHIMDPDLIKEILSMSYHFEKPKGGNPLVKLLVTGLVLYEGEKWAKHRKIANPAFNLEKLKCMVSAFYLSCNEMVEKWEDMVVNKRSCELDVWPYLQTLSSDVISRASFGSSYEEGRKICKLQNEQAELVIQAAQSIYIPGSRFFPTKRNRRMKTIDKEVKASIRDIIEQRLKTMKKGEKCCDDLLGILLESNFKECQLQGNKSSGMTIKEVIDECKLFYFAGQETTSSLLVWTMILLSKYPYWQSRARDEVFHHLGNNIPDFDDLNHLKTLNMIFNEVLRLYPAAALLCRTIHKETKLREISIPAGAILSLPIILLHHDNEIWGQDANEFNPERFSEGVSKVTKGKVCFFPFGWGPRICIGQNFAMLEVKMAFAMILQRFSFSLSPSYSHAPLQIITLQPQYGAHLILEKL